MAMTGTAVEETVQALRAGERGHISSQCWECQMLTVEILKHPFNEPTYAGAPSC
jgi:hypothetical protein